MKTLTTILVLLILFTSKSNHITFRKYEVSKIFKGRPAKIVIKGNPLAEMYRTIITDTYYSQRYMKTWRHSTGLNFAGHYCFAWWGCGSPCQHAAVVDLNTGIVYDGLTGSMGFQFKKTSKLVIVNPPDANGKANTCAFCNPEYWVWNERKKKFDKLNQ